MDESERGVLVRQTENDLRSSLTSVVQLIDLNEADAQYFFDEFKEKGYGVVGHREHSARTGTNKGHILHVNNGRSKSA